MRYIADAAERFRRFTGEHVKRRFAIVVDGTVISAPMIMEEISGKMALITMGLGSVAEQRDDALRRVASLRAGAAKRTKP